MKKILVVDDEIILREFLTELLELENYLAIGASGVEEALEIYRQHQPDLVICDIFLGHENGFEVLEQLKQSPDFSIPFIFMSAQINPELRERAEAEGVNAFIRKPYDNMLLLETIKNCFPGS